MVVGREERNGFVECKDIFLFFQSFTLKYVKFCVCDMCISVFRVCVFFNTVASSPVASAKCLLVGCTKTQKRLRLPISNYCVMSILDWKQYPRWVWGEGRREVVLEVGCQNDCTQYPRW